MNSTFASQVTSKPVTERLQTQDLVSTADLTPHEVESLLELASFVKARPADFRNSLAGKQLVMFFEKPSLRTRLTFEAGMASLGGVSFFVDQTQGRLGEREKLSDIAHNVERWVNVIVLRTFSHTTIEKMAHCSSIPVVNALSELEHPCQALADYFTLYKHFGGVKDRTLAYVGDGNNVVNSLLLTCAALGSSIRVATPVGYGPDAQIVSNAYAIAEETGANITLMTDPYEAVSGVDAVYTDAWVSMGDEAETETREKLFVPYQVNEDLMSHASPDAVFMHCLPAHRGQEVTDAVIDSPQSVVFDQAENRMHVQKAILLLLLEGDRRRFPVRSAHV